MEHTYIFFEYNIFVPFKVLSNSIFFFKEGVRVDVGFGIKEKKKEIGDRSQSFLGLFIHENSLKLS